MTDTIFAVSSGAPPAAIAVLRVSGPEAGMVARTLAGAIPEPRRATLRRLRDRNGATLDRALVLWFPGPDTATGEDLLELHLHGGRAVVAAVEQAIEAQDGSRRAEPGEFTRRALLNGRVDLTQAIGLADLLEAETETQRRAALTMSEGAFGRDVQGWLERVSNVRAMLEAAIDYDDEGDVTGQGAAIGDSLARLCEDLRRRLEAPTSERLREGLRIVIAGPPNAGKSSLLNAMVGRDAAIVSPVSGTTRDRIEVKIVRHGQIYTLVDTAGLAEWTDDPIEREGVRRSRLALAGSDLVLWVADEAPAEDVGRRLWVHSRSDEPHRGGTGTWDASVSVREQATIDLLWEKVERELGGVLRMSEPYHLHASQRDALAAAAIEIDAATKTHDPLMAADHLRLAATTLARLLGDDQVESMLDALFARFCVGK